MNRLVHQLAIAGSLIAFFQPLAAEEQRASEKEAVAFVKRAVEFYKKNGPEKAWAEFSNPQGAFIDRDLYIYAYTFEGMNVAHGANQKLVGRDLSELKDVDGKFVIKELAAVAKAAGAGWVDYKWANPGTKKIELKRGYVERVDNFFIGSGVYKQ